MSEPLTPDAQVTADELARVILACSKGTIDTDTIDWDELGERDRNRHVARARLVLTRLDDRRLTDPQRRAINGLRSAAHSISEDAADAVEEALSAFTGEELSTAGANSVLELIQRLDDDGLVDLIAGTTPLEDALRTARRKATR